ncbi:MAG: ABC transporter ATP-binding protein [Ilumatobacteraceae bacterium]
MPEAIRVEGVSKVFRMQADAVSSLKERVIRLGRSTSHDFVALERLDLVVPTGETLGVMGHNGSGKSTLLKCMAGILTPTTGRVRARGRIASLLELGAGFHPELTGRENVFINAAFLGIRRREIERRFDDIVEFAELERFIDEPVKHYSSGMYVRLGFAVAVNLDPEILLVDEVLAVGDELFQRKCLDRVREFQREGRTIIVVTHAADMVRQVCQRAIVLDHGRVVADARPADAIRVFREHLHGELNETHLPLETDDSLRITSVSIKGPAGIPRVAAGDSLSIDVDYEGRQPLERAMLTIEIASNDGTVVYATELPDDASVAVPLPAAGRLGVLISALPLLDGDYTVSLSLTDRNRADVIAWRDGRDQFTVTPGAGHRARGLVALGARIVSP